MHLKVEDVQSALMSITTGPKHHVQCGQLRDFVAIFSDFSDTFGDFFFKRQATNLAYFSVIGDFLR